MSDPNPAVPVEPVVPVVPAEPEFTKEELLKKLKTLTDTQNQMIQVLSGLQNRANDPFLQFKTPDPIKNLSPFSGNKKETYAWVEDTETTLNLFKAYENTPMHSQIVRAIKSKIVGEAKEVLIAAGNPSEWQAIKDVLLNSYGDRRDLPSHISSLFYARQGKRTLVEYYNKIKSIDTAIKTAAASTEEYKFATSEINKLISLMTLTRFVDGLGEQLSMFVRSYKPECLEEAYNITLQYSNAAYRQKLDRQPNAQTASSNKPKFNQTNDQQIANKQQPPFGHKQFTQNNSGHPKPSSSKFRNTTPTHDDDVTMRTHHSRMQVNNNEAHEPESDTPTTEVELRLDSEDDEYFEGDELNFHQATKAKQKT